MIKDELIGKLHTILNNFVFGVALRCFFPPDLWSNIANEQLVFEGIGQQAFVKLGPLVNRLSNEEDRLQLFDEYEKGLKRSLLREGHEILLGYCEITNQIGTYQAEPWFQFARIIRNVVSHKDAGVLRGWPKDLKRRGIGTVAWRTRTLAESMVGQPIAFPPHEALQLFDDQIRFVCSDRLR